MIYSLNQSQSGIYYASASQEEGSNYTISCLFDLSLDIDMERLRRSIEQAVLRHPHLLDTISTNEQGEPVFVRADNPQYHLTITQAPSIETMVPLFAQNYPLTGERLFDIYLIHTPKQNYLCLNIHHILMDGTGLQVLLGGISAAYSGECLSEAEREVIDINEAEKQSRMSERYKEEKQWYEQTFGGVENVSLPQKDVCDEVAHQYHSELYPLHIDKTAVQALCQKCKVGSSVPYTAAFAWTLRAFTGDEDICYTTFFHGRNKEQMRALTMMVRTLPMILHTANLNSVEELLTQTQQMLHDVRQKDTVGFGEVCEMGGINADVSFIYQGRITDSALRLDGQEFHWRYLSKHEPGVKLNIQVQEHGEGELFLQMNYPAHEYSTQWAEEFVASYEHILNQMCTHELLCDITPASPAQCQRIDQWMTEHPDYNSDEWEGESVVSLFKKAAQTYPDHIAFEFEDISYTYQQLDQYTDQLADVIASYYTDEEFSANPRPVIAILIPRNEWMVLAPLAALKAGCAYQPLDPSYPAERLNFMIQDSRAKLLFTTPELRPIVSEYQGSWIDTTLPVETQRGTLKGTMQPLQSEDLFIMLYTSGSTGVPKGVMLTHRNVLSFIHFAMRELIYSPETKAAAYASFGFDANIMDVYPTLLAGGTLYIIPEAIRLDLTAIGDFVEKHGITNFFMTTQVAQQFALSYDKIGQLRTLTMGGEKMMSMPLPSGYKLYNMYGPTETSLAVTYKQVVKNEINIPIGRPTDDTQLYIVDKAMHRLPIGAPGELVVVGKQVGIGYLNQPEKTAQAFITFEGKHAYRTGDIVRYRHDGDIEYVGRRDGQVKIRGFRIELKEIETIIREFPGIEEVTVQAFDYTDGGKYLVAYVVSPAPVDIKALEQFIGDSKPPYMVPAYTMQIDTIPLNVNQKVDKRALPKPDTESHRPTEENTSTAPLNQLEQQLKQIVVECIHQEDFSLTTPLVYAGLSSISAMKLATRLYKRYGVNLDVKALVKSYNLQDIENAILQLWMEGNGQAATATAPSSPTSDIVPLTGAQQGIYIDWEANRDALQYNVPLAIHLEGKTDTSRLEKALQAVVDAHPALQVHLVQHEGQVMMERHDQTVELHKMRVEKTLTPSDLQTYLQPFDLLNGALYHLTYIEEPQGGWLLMDIHHIIYDGLSVGILLRDFNQSYEGQTLSAETHSLLSFAQHEQQLRLSGAYEEAQQYFDGLIDDIESTHYPESEGLEEGRTGVGHTSTSVPRKEIEKTCHDLGITVNSYMTTIVAQLLHRITREQKVLFTTISNGRNDMQWMDTIGMFVQTLVVTSQQTLGTIGERMQAMHQQLQDTFKRDYYPFSEVASRHHIDPQILYAFQDGVMDTNISIGGQTTPVHTLSISVAKTPLSIQIKGTTNEYIIEAEYDKAIYGDQDMQQLCHIFATMALQSVHSNEPQQNILMTPSEDIPQMLAQSYGGDLEYDKVHTLPHWVQHYAKTNPTNTAVVDATSSLTYQQLDQHTDILGNMLHNKGVSKDILVGIMLPRIKEFLVSVVAIQKAGGAYLPLDSEYPNERLEYMLENSQSQVLITSHELFDLKNQEGDFHVPQVIFVEDIDWSQTAQPINEAQTDGLAYMIYTSGSTGRPKGVMLEHRNLMAFAGWRIQTYFPFSPDNNFLCHPSFCFDASICDLLIPLFAGSTIHILPENLRKDLDGIADYISSHHIDGLSMPTQLGMALLNNSDLPLKFIEMGGEKLVQTTPRKVQKINGYGPTEFACCSSYHKVQDDETDIPIGRPAPNSWSVIVDSAGNLMPWGMAGELCLIGEQMSRGYWHLPEKTAQVFTPCPFMPSHRMYHTGDLARYNEQGQLVYLGRIDHQVKLRGFRIEMGEIEAQLASFPNVTASIAIVQEIAGTKHLVGYFTASQTIDTTQLKAHLAQSLTSYMVPDALVQLQAFPLTPNGKIDRKQLPIPTIERSVEYIAPRNELEQQLCDIFSHITGVEQVGAKDDFFEIGGTSLLAIKAVIDITNLGKKIIYGDLFRLKTPEAIAAHLDPSLSTEQEQDTYYRFGDYDYSAIDLLLKNNVLPDQEIATHPLDNVLLTGVTGFMGIHVLDYLIRATNSTIYCLIRPRGQYSGESRLKTMMVYYLTDTHSALIGKRIHIIEDDITSANLAQTLNDIHIDTIINCAAMVKHFVVGKEMDKVNVEGVENLIAVAQQQHACLVHISTYSTAGFVPTSYRLNYTEQQLYIGQCTDNEYIRTKFLSERLVLQAVADGRIRGKVMRVGNLMARMEDGEFQINMHSNAFLNNLKSIKSLGLITTDVVASPMEMSPIDCVAQAICLLATTPDNMVLFHPFNNFRICRSLLIDEMTEMGYPIRLATPSFFREQLQQAMQDENRSEQMQGIIHYTTNIANGLYPLGADNHYTTQVLLWLGFHWPITTNQYIRSLLKALDGLAYFD